MRTRGIKKQFWLNEEEAESLQIKSTKAGLKECEYIRKIILDYELKEKPDDRFYEVMKNIRGLANNMNQLAKKAHSFGFIDELSYKRNAEQVIHFIEKIKDEYLRDKRG